MFEFLVLLVLGDRQQRIVSLVWCALSSPGMRERFHRCPKWLPKHWSTYYKVEHSMKSVPSSFRLHSSNDFPLEWIGERTCTDFSNLFEQLEFYYSTRPQWLILQAHGWVELLKHQNNLINFKGLVDIKIPAQLSISIMTSVPLQSLWETIIVLVDSCLARWKALNSACLP